MAKHRLRISSKFGCIMIVDPAKVIQNIPVPPVFYNLAFYKAPEKGRSAKNERNR